MQPGFGTYLRGIWRHKLKQYGPWKIVHRSLFHNAEKIGINPADLCHAMPMWEGAGNKPVDYARGFITSTVGNFPDIVWNDPIGFISPNWGVSFLRVKTGITDQFGDFTVIGNAVFHDPGEEGPSSYERIVDKAFGTGFIIARNSTDANNLLFGVIEPDSPFGTVVAVDDTTTPFSYAMSRKGINKAIYIDSKLKSETTVPSTLLDTTEMAYLGRVDSAQNQSLWSLGYGLLGSTAWSSNIIASIQENPWQLWQPVSPVFYSFTESTQLPINLTAVLNYIHASQGDQL